MPTALALRSPTDPASGTPYWVSPATAPTAGGQAIGCRWAALTASPFEPLFAPYFEGEQVEWVLTAGLDTRGHLVDFYGMDDGYSSNAHLIHCVRAVLRRPDVRAVVIAHNHPVGPARPSPEDIAATRQIAALCRLANARLIDHLIYAPQGTASLRSLGLLH